MLSKSRLYLPEVQNYLEFTLYCQQRLYRIRHHDIHYGDDVTGLEPVSPIQSRNNGA